MFCLAFSSMAFATNIQEHAGQLVSSARTLAQTTSPSIVPGFETASPPETVLNDHHTLEAAMAQAFINNEAAAFLEKSASSRPYFQIDIERDLIVENASGAIQTPEAILNHPIEMRENTPEYDIVICQESKPSVEITCSKSLLPPEFWVEPATYDSWWCTLGKHGSCDPKCGARAYTSRAQPEQLHIQKETWTSTCQTLEAKAKLGICKLIAQDCPGGLETREVVGKVGDSTATRPLTRDCWRYEMRYVCTHPSLNTCESLRKKGCEQMRSACLITSGDICVEWKQTYRCSKPKEGVKKGLFCSTQSKPFGKIEAGVPVLETPNRDLQEAISKLQILREVQDELRSSGNSVSLPLLFKGCRKACTIAFANFKNCCTRGKGWGVDLGLSGCDDEDKDLAERKRKGLCHEIGIYCAEKPFGICLRKKRVSCCFPIKLSRVLHEQGRAQLGISWGDAENPDCRGLTPEELTRINFDQLNLSEVFVEVASRMRSTTAEVVKRNLAHRVDQMTSSFTDHANMRES